MKQEHILARDSLELLSRLARSQVLIALDYDGTLAPIVDRPGDARLRPRTRDLVGLVAARYPCVVISGRAQDDLMRRTRGLGVAEAIGNHGLSPSRYDEARAARVRGFEAGLARAAAALPGVEIENKIFSLAAHYRRAADKAMAREALLEAARALDGARVRDGKQVVDIVPEDAPHKGDALLAARARLGCDAALFVGDDTTDEDVFSLGESAGVLGVRVEPDASSRAPYFLRDQGEIDGLLAWLLEVRGPSLRALG